MSDLAERLAPLLAALVHPGDADTPPFPLSLPTFQAAAMPEGLAAEDAEELGLPTPNLNKHFLEAVIHLLETEGGVELVDHAVIADLRSAAAANETRRNQQIELLCRCGTKLGRLMVEGFDTEHPRVNGPELIKGMQSKTPDCTKGHRP